jgi:hypothetical protein
VATHVPPNESETETAICTRGVCPLL